MGRGTLSREAYTRVVREVEESGGSTTFRGEQRQKEGKGLHELVDPKGYGVIRPSRSWYEPEGDKFKLFRGVAMLEETRLDTTGSMGDNVERAMKVLPATHHLLQTGEGAVLGRYDVQMITSIFADVNDTCVLCRSQAEIDERIAEQMTYMFPEGEGGDFPEDPQYGLFGGAFLTASFANKYGLRYYDFTISDATGRDQVSPDTLIRVFGDKVFEKLEENRKQIDPENEYGMGLPKITARDLPSTHEIVTELQKRAHAFFLYVPDGRSGRFVPETGSFWRRIYGKEHVVQISAVKYLPYVKAAIIGLTEGTLDLQTVEEFLVDNMIKAEEKADHQDGRHIKEEAAKIVRAVSGIPIGAQRTCKNFHRIPLKGTIFAKRYDLWPIENDGARETSSTPPKRRIKWNRK